LQSQTVWLPRLLNCIFGCYSIPSPKGEGFTDPLTGTLNWFIGIAWLEVFKAISTLLIGLAWPGSVVLLGYFFRKEISSKLADVETAGPGGVTFHKQQQPKADAMTTELIPHGTLTPFQKVIEDSIIKDLDAIADDKKMPILIAQLALAKIDRFFEYVYANIFGTQVHGLQQLRDAGGTVTLVRAEQFFDEVKAKFPEFYVNITFAQWFRYLEINRFAVIEAANVKLTDMGTDFLQFVAAQKAGDQRAY